MENLIFAINDEPYCLWGYDLDERNSEFLNGIDTKYFDYLLNLYLDSDEEKRAAIAIRITLHHAIETFFSFLGAYIQAPKCVYAWMEKCSNKQLRKFVESVGEGNNQVITILNINSVSWFNIAESIFRKYESGTEKNIKTTKLYEKLWRRLAHEFLEQNYINEYNSIKHGFRIRPGGFSLTIGTEKEYGVSKTPEQMRLMGKSKYGSTFFKIETIGKNINENRSLCSRRYSINWMIEKDILLTQLVSMSIQNIVSALRVLNGVDPRTCKYIRPSEDDAFEKPWAYSRGVFSINMDYIINEKNTMIVTREQLLEKLNKQK